MVNALMQALQGATVEQAPDSLFCVVEEANCLLETATRMGTKAGTLTLFTRWLGTEPVLHRPPPAIHEKAATMPGGIRGYPLSLAIASSRLHHLVEDLPSQHRKRGPLELPVLHVPGDDGVVVGHALDHEALDEVADAEGEALVGVGPGNLDDLLVAPCLLLDLLKREPVLIGERGGEAGVEDLDDLRERHPFIGGLAGSDLGGATDGGGLPAGLVDGARVDSLETVVLEGDFVGEIDGLGVGAEGQVREQEATEAVEQIVAAVGVGQDLAEEGVELDVGREASPELAALLVVGEAAEAVDGGLEVALHVGVVRGVLLVRRAVEDLGEGLHLIPGNDTDTAESPTRPPTTPPSGLGNNRAPPGHQSTDMPVSPIPKHTLDPRMFLSDRVRHEVRITPCPPSPTPTRRSEARSKHLHPSPSPPATAREETVSSGTASASPLSPDALQ